ncbi:MAG: NUDIX hydrolase [Patescibacteria group bacterium]
MAGSVYGMYLPTDETIAVAPNIKRKIAILKCLKENRFEKDFPFLSRTIENLESVMKKRGLKQVPLVYSSWVFEKWRKERVYPPKIDVYGLPGGEIDEYEIQNYPTDYFDYALPREFAEETGLSPIIKDGKDEKGRTIYKNLFRRSSLLWAKDNREENGKTYENYFFHVFGIDPTSKLNTEGVEEETEAPEIVQISKLGTEEFPFYPKHAIGLKILLRQLLEAGQAEYEPALKHIEEKYPWTPEQRGLSFEKLDPEPTIVLTDDEAWIKAVNGVKKI